MLQNKTQILVMQKTLVTGSVWDFMIVLFCLLYIVICVSLSIAGIADYIVTMYSIDRNIQSFLSVSISFFKFIMILFSSVALLSLCQWSSPSSFGSKLGVKLVWLLKHGCTLFIFSSHPLHSLEAQKLYLSFQTRCFIASLEENQVALSSYSLLLW